MWSSHWEFHAGKRMQKDFCSQICNTKYYNRIKKNYDVIFPI